MSVFTSLLNNTFAVERRDRLADGQGGWTIIYAEVGTIQGRICPSTGAERVVADSEEQQITHTLYCSAGEDVARGDRVTCADLAVEVLGIREPSKAGEHWEIDCLERQYEETEELGS
jgi:head-tail adaptor